MVRGRERPGGRERRRAGKQEALRDHKCGRAGREVVSADDAAGTQSWERGRAPLGFRKRGEPNEK